VYDPYGQATVLSASWTATGDGYAWAYRHQGLRYDTAAGYYDSRLRAYSPTLGRFAQGDPLGFGVRDVNLYRAEGNGSTGLTDPTGLDPSLNPGQTSGYRPDVMWTAGGPNVAFLDSLVNEPNECGNSDKKWSHELATPWDSDGKLTPTEKNPKFAYGMPGFTMWLNHVLPSELPKGATQAWQMTTAYAWFFSNEDKILTQSHVIGDFPNIGKRDKFGDLVAFEPEKRFSLKYIYI
jgi:RHS repeat-associated protein